MWKNLLDKKVALAIIAALIAIFAALPWATGLRYACMIDSALGGNNPSCVEAPATPVEGE